MNNGCLYVEEETEGQLICGIVFLPTAILTPPCLVPPCIYSTEQLPAIQQGQALVPGLQNIIRTVPLRTFAAGIPTRIAEGTMMPMASAVIASDALTWQASTTYTLTQAEIVPFIDPALAPTIDNAWGVTARLTFGSTARDLFNPEDYDPPETAPGENMLYFPNVGHFTRRRLVVMADYAGVHGGYYYPLTSLLYPAFAYLYVNQDVSTYSLQHYFRAPKTSYTSIEIDDIGLKYGDQFNSFDPYLDDALAAGARGMAKHDNMGFVTELYSFGHTGIVTSEGLGHWCSADMPALVFPGEPRKAAGIAPLLGVLLFLGAGSLVSAGQIAKRRRVQRE